MSYDPFEGKTPDRYLWVSATGSPAGDGSKEHPLSNIQTAIAKAKPGTAIMVEAGEYNTNISINRTADGTPDKPIWLVSADGPGAAHIIAADNSKAAIGGGGIQNFIVDGFWTTGGKNGIQFSQNGMDHTDMFANVVVRNNLIEGFVEDGVKINGGDGAYVYNNVVRGGNDEGIDLFAVVNGEISGNEVSGNTGTSAAIFAKGGSENILISGNYVHDNKAIGISVGGYVGAEIVMRTGHDTYQAKNVLVSDNIIVNSGKMAAAVFGSVDVTISNNYMAANAKYYTAVSVGNSNPTMYGTFSSHNIAILDNFISEHKNPLTIQAGSDGVTMSNSGSATVLKGFALAHLIKGDLPPLNIGTVIGDALLIKAPDAPVLAAPAPDPSLLAAQKALSQGWADGIAPLAAVTRGVGTANADLLSGRATSYAGGEGDDTYRLGQATINKIVEKVSAGVDTVQAEGRYLRLPGNVENLQLVSKDGAILAGNADNNKMVGNIGNDVLIGGGGANWLDGNGGLDRFVIDKADSLTRIRNFSSDDVVHVTGMTMGSFAELKNAMYELDGSTILTLTDGRIVIFEGTGIGSFQAEQFVLEDPSRLAQYSGAASGRSFTPNGNTHIAQGDQGNNTLTGKGDSVLIGGNGDDRYVLKSAADHVIEASHGGVDTVLLQFDNYVLEAGVENVLLRAKVGATIVGNGLANIIEGNLGADVITGGAGADVLTGGKGSDTFVYRSLGDAGDHITDFTVGSDHLDMSAFTAANPNASFHIGTVDGDAAVYAAVGGQDVLLVTLDNVAATALSAADLWI